MLIKCEFAIYKKKNQTDICNKIGGLIVQCII